MCFCDVREDCRIKFYLLPFNGICPFWIEGYLLIYLPNGYRAVRLISIASLSNFITIHFCVMSSSIKYGGT